MKTRSILLFVLVMAGGLTACASQAEQIEEPAGEQIIFFVDQTEIIRGECTILHWDVVEGFGVTINDQPVPKAGEREVCPTEPQIFALAVDMGDHLEIRNLEILVHPSEGLPDDEQPGVLARPEIIPGPPAYLAGTWLSTGGPPGGLGYDIRMDPRNPDVMYVTDALAGAFKSLDGGATWFPINNGISTRGGTSGDAIPVFSLTIDPNHPDTLWAGTQFGSTVFRSDDAGQNWRPMSNGILERQLSIRGLTVEPGNSNVVYLAGEISSWEWNNEVGLPGLGLDMTKGAVYKTTNGGQNWKRIWIGNNLARYIWIHPDDHNLIYVSTGIFDREAANSDPVKLEPGGVGILRSRDGGNTWQELGVANGIHYDELYIGSLFMHPQNPDILIAASGNDPYTTALQRPLGAIYLTEDGGDSWQRVLSLVNASTVEICSGNPNVVYAGSRNGIHRSEDGGHTWVETAGDLWGSEDVLAGFPIDMQCDPRDARRIFVNNYIGGNFLSEDAGQTWQVSSKGYTGAIISQVNVSYTDPLHVYSSSRMGVFASRDGGDDWTGTGFFPARVPEAVVVAVDRFDGDHIMAVYLDAGPDPLVSWDGGKNWDVLNTGLFTTGDLRSGTITDIIFSPYEPFLVLATSGDNGCPVKPESCVSETGHGIIRSTDRGQTWVKTDLTNGQVVDVRFGSGSLVYAAVYPDTIYRSEDSGATWKIVAQGFSSQISLIPGENADTVIQQSITSIAVDPFEPDRLLAGFLTGGLMISTDAGVTWNRVAAGLPPEMSVKDIETDKVHPGVFYVGSVNTGVFYSINSGATWTVLNTGLSTRHVTDLALSEDGSVLYMASDGGGVFQLGIQVK